MKKRYSGKTVASLDYLKCYAYFAPEEAEYFSQRHLRTNVFRGFKNFTISSSNQHNKSA